MSTEQTNSKVAKLVSEVGMGQTLEALIDYMKEVNYQMRDQPGNGYLKQLEKDLAVTLKHYNSRYGKRGE